MIGWLQTILSAIGRQRINGWQLMDNPLETEKQEDSIKHIISDSYKTTIKLCICNTKKIFFKIRPFFVLIFWRANVKEVLREGEMRQ